MSENNRKEFRKLVGKYLNGNATEEERRILESYYKWFDSAPEVSEILSKDQLEALGARMKEKIPLKTHPQAKLRYHRYYFRAAALVLLLLGTVWLVRINTIKQPVLSEQVSQIQRADDSASRFLTLPDGSTVVLHKGSELELSADFNGASRTVYLTGEAYFDVARRENSPFTIHTGKVKTTVLGTAFNIKAWPDQKDITVSVSRGKVQVEDDKKLIAVLTSDKQVTYDTESSISDQKHVEAEIPTAWVQQEMTFDDMPFGELASHLSKRYDVEIRFKNKQLEQCPITGRFTGTETLGEVMRTLALTSNARFSFTGNEVFIEGEKCL